MNYFPELQYRFPIITPAGTATIDFPETQWDVPAQAAITGPGAATVKDYLSVHGIGFYGHLFTLDAVSPMDLHHALTMNATIHKDLSIFRFDVIGYVPEENPAENDLERWKDEEEDGGGLVLESAGHELNIYVQLIFESASGPVVATLTGKELGDDDNPKELRKKAEAYYREHFKGTLSHRSGFKQPIRYSNKGLNEFIHFSSDPDKLLLMPALKAVIEKGDYEGREKVSHPRKDEIVAFHLIKANVSLAGRLKEVRVEIGEDTQGHLFYDLFPDRTEHDIKRAKPHQGEESESSFNAARVRRVSPSDNSNIPPSKSEVKNDVVTESATFNPTTAIRAARSFQDIVRAFRRVFPFLIPADTLTVADLKAQGFIVDTNIDGAIVSLRLAGTIALRNSMGFWKLYDGEIDEKNLIADDFSLDGVAEEMQQFILESALTADEIHDIAHQAATSHKNDLPEPTEGQAKAGNYKHAHLKLYGLDITIENPAGSKRSGVDPDGKPWECTIPAHYGYFLKTEGSDGDHVDCYIGEHPESEQVFIVDQMDIMTGCFDEHKCVLAAQDETEARGIYIAGFSDGKGLDRIGAITEMNMDEFKIWLAEGETTQPAGRITVPQI